MNHKASPRTVVYSRCIIRADIECSLQSGSRPRFDWESFPQVEIIMMSENVSLTCPYDKAHSEPGLSDSKLDQAFSEVSHLCELINSRASRLTPLMFQEILTSLCYRLLHLYPFASVRPIEDVDDACHTALLAFMTSFLFQHGRFERLPYRLLRRQLSSSVNRLLKAPEMNERALWLLFVGGVTVFESHDRIWLIPAIKACLIALKIDEWTVALGILKSRAWVGCLHDEDGYRLWQAALLT